MGHAMSADVATALTGRRVLVTGGSGFLGSHLLRALVAGGARVHAIVRPSTATAWSAHGVDTHVCDLLDPAALAHTTRLADPECVFHLAAYGTTGSQPDEARMLAVNVTGTRNLWDALEQRPCRVIQTGTCAEYGDVRGPIPETHVCQPRFAYPASVHAAVTWSQARGFETGREVVILRPFGPFGPDDRPERLLPAVIQRLVSGQRAPVSAGDQLRDYSYVADHVTAILLAASCPLPRPVAVYNVGTGNPVTVRALIEMVAREIGGDAPGRVDFGARPVGRHEPAEMYADMSSIARDLGYAPAIDLREGVRRTVAAYRAGLVQDAGNAPNAAR